MTTNGIQWHRLDSGGKRDYQYWHMWTVMASRIISIDVLWLRFQPILGHDSRGNGWYAMASGGQWWQASSSVLTYYGYVSFRRGLQFGQYWTMGAMTKIGMQRHGLDSGGECD